MADSDLIVLRELSEKLQILLQQAREKLCYYLVGLNLSCIGFSIYQTMNLAISIELIPLGLAILSWASGIFFGLQSIKQRLESIQINVTGLRLKTGELDSGPINKHYTISALESLISDNEVKVNATFNYSQYSLYAGVILFLIWRIFLF